MIGRWKKSRGALPGPACRPPVVSEFAADPAARMLQHPEVPAGSVENLDRTLALLMEFTHEGSVPASVIVNPLLTVWDAAHGVGRDVSVPVEALLTVAVHRSTIVTDEIRDCVMEVRARAIQEAVLSDLVRG